MRLRCKFFLDGAGVNENPSHDVSTSCESAGMIIVVPAHLQSSTVDALARFLASKWQTLSTHERPPKLVVAGFTLLSTQIVRQLLRDDEEVFVCSPDETSAGNFGLTLRTSPSRVNEATDSSVESHPAKFAAIEWIQRDTPTKPTSADIGCASQSLASSTQQSKAKRGKIASWTNVAPESLLSNDRIRYRIRLVDAWAGRQKRSAVREAVVFRVNRGGAADGWREEISTLVLKQLDGSMDCVEPSSLLDLYAFR